MNTGIYYNVVTRRFYYVELGAEDFFSHLSSVVFREANETLQYYTTEKTHLFGASGTDTFIEIPNDQYKHLINRGDITLDATNGGLLMSEHAREELIELCEELVS
jgi:hypothetical protein